MRNQQKKLSAVAGRHLLKTAIGLAVPAIEAWYLSGQEQRVSEAAWITGLHSGNLPYTKKELKQTAYGADRPSMQLETEKAVEHAERIAKDLTGLKARFPTGFGWLYNDIKKTAI